MISEMDNLIFISDLQKVFSDELTDQLHIKPYRPNKPKTSSGFAMGLGGRATRDEDRLGLNFAFGCFIS